MALFGTQPNRIKIDGSDRRDTRRFVVSRENGRIGLL